MKAKWGAYRTGSLRTRGFGHQTAYMTTNTGRQEERHCQGRPVEWSRARVLGKSRKSQAEGKGKGQGPASGVKGRQAQVAPTLIEKYAHTSGLLRKLISCSAQRDQHTWRC